MVMECKICLTRFTTRSSPGVYLPCDYSHTFHSDCLTHWFVSNRECPVCGKASSSALMTLLNETKPAPTVCRLLDAERSDEEKNGNSEDDDCSTSRKSCCCGFSLN